MMETITKDTVLTAHTQEPRRKCFANTSGIQENKKKPTFSVWIESAKKVFQAETGLKLFYSKEYKNYWRFIKTENELEKIKKWEENQGKLIFLRDCLSLSVALDTNLKDACSGQYTEIGELERKGKRRGDESAINQLVDKVSEAIHRLPYYKDADLICAVPPEPGKDFDFPSRVTELVSERIGKRNVTSGFVFDGQKSSITNSTFDGKWAIWEDTQISFKKRRTLKIKDKTIILIDDKYQSGITIQYIAMKLQEAGVREVYGLTFVKTLRDTDNV